MMNFSNNDFSQVLAGRRSVRHFQADYQIDRQELEEILAATIQAPSACNLQPWKFVVFDTPAGKESLKPAFMPFNYPQLQTASAMILILADSLAFESYRDVWNQACEAGKISPERRDEILQTFLPLYERAPKEWLVLDGMRSASMAAMQLMLVAKAYGYDTNAIAGYQSDALLDICQLDKDRYVAVMAIAIGKADESAAEVQTSRYPLDQVMTFYED